MSNTYLEKTRSFIITLYDGAFKERFRFAVPVSVAAPFANRILREELPEQLKTTREPWYKFIPHDSHERPMQRSLQPEGPTSLYGTRYDPEKERPPRLKLHPEAHITFFTVVIVDFEKEIFQGEYGVDDIFLSGAEFLARGLIEKGSLQMDAGPFYYKVEVSANEVRTAPRDILPPEAYQVEGVFRLPQLEKKRERITFRKVPSLPLKERNPASFGETQTHGHRGKQCDNLIYMHTRVYQTLREGLSLSSRVEDGGYLLGIPYRQPGTPENEDDPKFRWLLEITDVVQAEDAWGRAGLLFFTGDTWSRITRRIDIDYPDKKLVSWFHTHLFRATDEFGLSGLDQDLHRRFLTKPWQVAVLINIDHLKGEREVRCFQRTSEGDLVECTFEVFDEKTEN